MSIEHLITFRAEEFATADEAVQHYHASGRGEAILLGGRYYVVSNSDAERLESTGVPFAYVYDVEGQVVTIPVNSDNQRGGRT